MRKFSGGGRSVTAGGQDLQGCFRMQVGAGRNKDTSRTRLAFGLAVFLLAWLGLWLRAGWVQLVMGPHYAELARRQHLSAEFERGKRGEILDRNGVVLAKSIPIESVYARPLEVADAAQTARVLAPILNEPVKELAAKLRSKKNFVWLVRQIGDHRAAKVREKALPGIYLVPEYARLYPNGHVTGQLLGFVGLDGEGLEGLERSLDPELAGRGAQVVLARDASGRKLYLDAHGREMDIDGRDVRLTIDVQVQTEAETALARAVTKYGATWGGCLVVDVPSGHILAWASFPYFNPNAYRGKSPSRWRNRLALDIIEPGSTMKPFLVAAALQEGLVRPADPIFCENGRWRLRGKIIRDTHEYGELSVTDLLSLSSNIGSAKLGLLLGPERFSAYLDALGFGRPTGLPLSAESRGLIRSYAQWNEIDTAAASFGQGVGVTVLQLAKAYLVLAADGEDRPLRLLMPADADREEPKRIFSAEVARAVRAMLVKAVAEGTGTSAQIPGLAVGGKTGTAQKASPEGGYGSGYISSFAGLVPGDEPRYLVVAVLDEPTKEQYYGGLVAAPVVRDVAIKTLAYYGVLPGEVLAAVDAETPAMAAGPVADGRVVPASAPSSAEAVPDLRGLDLRKAVEILARGGRIPQVQGSGPVVVKQKPLAGRPWPGTNEEPFILWLSQATES